MRFNVDKCKVMHFGRNNQQFDYKLDRKTLQTVQEEKDLGIIISQDLKPSPVLSSILKANRMLGVINRCIVYKTKDILLCLYKSLVRPHLEYCTVAWSPHYVKDKKTVGARSKKVYSFTS